MNDVIEYLTNGDLIDLSELSKDEDNIDVMIKSNVIFGNRPIEIIFKISDTICQVKTYMNPF